MRSSPYIGDSLLSYRIPVKAKGRIRITTNVLVKEFWCDLPKGLYEAMKDTAEIVVYSFNQVDERYQKVYIKRVTEWIETTEEYISRLSIPVKAPVPQSIPECPYLDFCTLDCPGVAICSEKDIN